MLTKDQFSTFLDKVYANAGETAATDFTGTQYENLAQQLLIQKGAYLEQEKKNLQIQFLGQQGLPALPEDRTAERDAWVAERLEHKMTAYTKNMQDRAALAFGEEAIPAMDTDKMVRTTLESGVAGALGGDVTGGLKSGLMGGVSSFIFSLPMVGHFLQQASTYLGSLFSDKKLTWEEAGEQAEASSLARRVGEALNLDPQQTQLAQIVQSDSMSGGVPIAKPSPKREIAAQTEPVAADEKPAEYSAEEIQRKQHVIGEKASQGIAFIKETAALLGIKGGDTPDDQSNLNAALPQTSSSKAASL